MGLGYISDATVSGWLSTLRSTARYASLHFEVPNWADPGASEVFEAGYARQFIYWTTESARGITTSTALTFPAVPQMTIVAIGMWADLTGGTMVAYAAADPGNAVYIPSTQTFTLPIGELSVRLP